MNPKPFGGLTCPNCCNQYFRVVYTLYPYTNDGVLICSKCGQAIRKLYNSEIERFKQQ